MTATDTTKLFKRRRTFCNVALVLQDLIETEIDSVSNDSSIQVKAM